MSKLSKFLGLIIILGAALLGAWSLSNSVTPIITTNGRLEALSDELYALYLDIENTGGPDLITGVSIDQTGRTSFMGVPDNFTPVLPGSSKASFSSDGAHIMLKANGEKLVPGTLITLSLDFQHAGRVPVKAVVGDDKDMKQDGNNIGMDHSRHQMGASLQINDVEKAPSVQIAVSKNAGGGFDIVLATQKFQFVEPVDDPPQHVFGEGHGHLYLNGLKLQRVYTRKAKIGALPPGKHRVSVSLNTNDHRVYSASGKRVEAFIDVLVDE